MPLLHFHLIGKGMALKKDEAVTSCTTPCNTGQNWANLKKLVHSYDSYHGLTWETRHVWHFWAEKVAAHLLVVQQPQKFLAVEA